MGQQNEVQVEEQEIDVTEIIDRIEKLENEIKTVNDKLSTAIDDITAIAETLDDE